MKLLLVDDEPISMNQIIQGVDWASCNVNAVYIAYNADSTTSPGYMQAIRENHTLFATSSRTISSPSSWLVR